MAEEQQFCLRWNNFQVNITSQFEALRDDEDFVDVTLACEGKRLKAHKVVLSACSPYFKDLFKSNPCKHPILFMRDVEFHHLQSLVEFMYAGEVNIAQAQLSAFLRTAESLQIRGLTEAPQRHKQMDGRSGSAAGSSRWGAGSPGGGSRTPSPEEAEQEGEEEMLSLSPPCSPPPTKRSCQAGDKSNNVERLEDTGSASSHHRTHSDQYENLKNEALDIVEPKVEIPDYCSDGEGRTDNPSVGMYQGMDNSVDMTPSFQGLQGGGGGSGGGMDILPGPSAQNYMGEASQDSGHADQRKLHSLDPRPCPICYRMYSNLSNLRQHLRLIHNPQTVSCPLCSKPFKTKLYLKRHLMSFHELVCTTPKAGGAAVVTGKGSNASEFFPSPQMPLGKQTGDDRNGVYNSAPPAKPKDTSTQELVAEFFQGRTSYQGSKNANVGGSGFQKTKVLGPNEDRSNFHTGYDVNPFHLRNQDRYQTSHTNKSQEAGNYLPPASNDNRYNVPPQQSRNVGGDRSGQYHCQSGSNSQDSTPAFLNLLSLTKNEDCVSYGNPQQSQAADMDENPDNTSVDHETTADVTSS